MGGHRRGSRGQQNLEADCQAAAGRVWAAMATLTGTKLHRPSDRLRSPKRAKARPESSQILCCRFTSRLWRLALNPQALATSH